MNPDIIDLYDADNCGITIEMIHWCQVRYGKQSTNTWKLHKLQYIYFYNQNYYTMFLLYWSDKLKCNGKKF